MRVMFYVQHLLGIGHIRRAALFSAAMSGRGQDVTVVLGGRDVPGIDFGDADVIRLPAAHVADHTFTPLLDENNTPVEDAWKTRRKDDLLATFKTVRPDVIVVEMFPFGRRQFRFELLPLLEAANAARPRPFIVSSVRDILVNKPKSGRNHEIVTLVREHFDLVLVHGDETLVKLDDSFPQAYAISDLIRYTGYIAAPDEEGVPINEGSGEVIVTAGGGAVGKPLLNVALAAKEQSRLAERTWRFITGPNLPDADFRQLREDAPDDVIVERFRSDLPRMLRNCTLSISQGGYNTIMDLLRAKKKAIVVPYDDGGESEQLQRARLLAEKNLFKVVESGNLSVSTLCEAINETIAMESSGSDVIDLSGAETAAHMIADLVTPDAMAGGLHG